MSVAEINSFTPARSEPDRAAPAVPIATVPVAAALAAPADERAATSAEPAVEPAVHDLVAMERHLEFERTESGNLMIRIYDGRGRLVRAVPPESFAEFLREQIGSGFFIDARV